MKKIIICIFIFLFFTCSIDNENEKVKKEIITETNNTTESGYKKIDSKVYPKQQITFKLPAFSSNLYAGDGNGYVNVDATTKADNFIAGVFYFDNSINSTDILYQDVWRILDLSANIGAQTHRVTMYVKIIDCGADGETEYSTIKFRTPGINFEPKIITSNINDEYWYTAELTTDENGCIEWCYAGANPYDAKTDLGDPDYHCYQWLQCEIWLYESWKSDIINQ